MTTALATRRPLPTASKMARVMACPGSEALPHVERSSPAASRGTAIHLFLEQAAKQGRDAALALVEDPDARKVCELLDLSSLPIGLGQYTPELVVAWHPGTGHAYAVANDEEGARAEGYVTARLDVAAVAPIERKGFIIDWKTGRAKLGKAENHAQLRVGALLLARTYDLASVDVALGYLDEYGEVRLSRATLDAIELAGIEEQIREALAKREAAIIGAEHGVVPDVSMGEWCQHCPAFAACPGQTGLVRVLAADPSTLEVEIRASLTPENGGRAYLRLKQAKAVLEALEGAVKAAAKELGGFPLPDGTIYGPVTKDREEVDGPAAYRAMAEVYGPAAAASVSKVEVTKGDVEKLARILHSDACEMTPAGQKRPTLKSVIAETMGVLRNAGAIRTVPRTEVRVHKPEEGAR